MRRDYVGQDLTTQVGGAVLTRKPDLERGAVHPVHLASRSARDDLEADDDAVSVLPDPVHGRMFRDSGLRVKTAPPT